MKSRTFSPWDVLNVCNYTQSWALASIYCAWPVRCCIWASNLCCRYAFKMHMQWITSLGFDRMINYLQRCCKILPSIEWVISSGVLNLAEMYEFRGSVSKLNVHLPVLSVAVFGVYDCVWGVYVSDGRRERECMCAQGAEHDCAVEECGGKSKRALNETTESSEKDLV